MRDESNTRIRLVVAGVECDTWDDASIDSDIYTPADAFSLTLWLSASDRLQYEIKAGAALKLYYGEELVLTGIIDSLSEAVGRAGRALQLSGRDLAGQLIDCSVPIFNGRQLALKELLKRYVTGGNLGSLFKTVTVQNDAWLKNKVSVEPGESIWDALEKAAQVTGQWIWINADGSLSVGDPFANPYQVQTALKLMYAGTGNNILSAEYTEDVSRVYSDIHILSQDADATKILAQGTSSTPYAFKRLSLITSADVETQSEANSLLKKIQKDNDLEAYSLTCDVAGWTIDGKVWQAGWNVSLESDVLTRANAKWVVMGRTLMLSRQNGQTVRLKLKRQGDWAQPLKYKDKK